MANKVLNYAPTRNLPASAKETYKDLSMKSSGRSGGTYVLGRLVDIDAVKNSIHNIFSWIPGERILDPEFGNKIRQHLYDGITETTSEQIVAEIRHAVEKYEPRAEIDSVSRIDSTDDNERNTIGLNIVWHVVGLPTQKYTEAVLR